MISQLSTFSERILQWANIASGDVMFGNTLGDYALSLVIFFVSLVSLGLVQHIVLVWLAHLASRTKTELDDTFVRMVESFRPPFYVLLSFWLATKYLALTGAADAFLTGVLVVWLVYQSVVIAGIVVEDIIFQHFAKDRDETVKGAIHLLANIVKGMMWVFGLLLVLSNFGIDITSLIAGAGIAGVAIAFALQGVLGDLFSSFSLYFDKPFKIGDFIIVGDIMGTVKHIGIKSTRILSLSGEEIVMSNQELTGARIRNFKRMQERRIAFSFGILYETPVERVRQVPGIVKEIIETVSLTRFDRAHFKSFGDSSLDFEVVYYLLDADYNKYMDAQQAVNLALMERFEVDGIGFAYPTRTLKFDSSEVLTVRTKE